jgi:hypothetical protein
MTDLSKALETQLKNIQAKTGKTLDELAAIAQKSGLTKHGQVRDMFKRDLNLGHGDANTLTHTVLKSDGASAAKEKGASIDGVLVEIYSGPKAELRPIHDKLMAVIEKFGEFEIAAKKGYVSLRRKKQFAMIGPATNTRVEVGLNMKGVKATGPLIEMPPGQMCQYKVKLTDVKEVNKELTAWIKQAFDSAG